MLGALGLAKAIDFRGESERAAAPYDLPGVEQLSLAIEPMVSAGVHALVAAGRPVTAEAATALMRDLYRAFVSDRAPQFAEFFDYLLHADAPVVFHCTAGKDRTGYAAALVLLALGVPRPLEPVSNVAVADGSQPVTLVVENSTTTGSTPHG